MMDNGTQIPLAQQYAATLDWWRDAGVDCDFQDEASGWLEEPADQKPAQATRPQVVAAADEPAHKPAIALEDLPQDLPGFRAWWLDAATPLLAGSGPRIAPRGKAGAPLMLLVPMPEEGDRDELLKGPQGSLLANIARALGLEGDAPYFASALPAHLTLPDWEALGKDGLGSALTRHIELAQPERVILFGSKLPAILGHDAAAPPENFREIAGVPALATFAPERLIGHAPQRARLWHRLLEWTA